MSRAGPSYARQSSLPGIREYSQESDIATLNRPVTTDGGGPSVAHQEEIPITMPDDYLQRQYTNPGPGLQSRYFIYPHVKRPQPQQDFEIPGSENGTPVDDLDHQPYRAEEVHDERQLLGHEEHKELMWTRVRHYMRDPFAEFLGCVILIIFGAGSVAQVLLSANPNLPASAQNKGEYLSIPFGWGIGVMLGVYVAGCSGGHINPAVTLALCIFRGFPWKKLPIYAVAQILGCFVGAAIIYGNYVSAIDAFEGGPGIRTVPGSSDNATAGIFSTYPAPFMTTVGTFFSEFIASGVLMFMILVLKDDSNLGAGNLLPLALFFVVFGIGATLGWETSFAINVARDLGPRLLTLCVGYGTEVFTASNFYFLIPLTAPFCGCVFGAFLYDLLLFTGESPINTLMCGFSKRFGTCKGDGRSREVDEEYFWQRRADRKGSVRRARDLETGINAPSYPLPTMYQNDFVRRDSERSFPPSRGRTFNEKPMHRPRSN